MSISMDIFGFRSSRARHPERMKKMRYYGVKLAFSWEMKKPCPTIDLEERVLLFKCRDEKELDRLVAKERKDYCRRDPKANFRIKPVSNKYIIYFIADVEQGDNPMEVYSNIHRNKRSKKVFLKSHLF